MDIYHQRLLDSNINGIFINSHNILGIVVLVRKTLLLVYGNKPEQLKLVIWLDYILGYGKNHPWDNYHYNTTRMTTPLGQLPDRTTTF